MANSHLTNIHTRKTITDNVIFHNFYLTENNKCCKYICIFIYLYINVCVNTVSPRRYVHQWTCTLNIQLSKNEGTDDIYGKKPKNISKSESIALWYKQSVRKAMTLGVRPKYWFWWFFFFSKSRFFCFYAKKV